MDEPKRHVVEDVPASELPDRIRGPIDPSHHARVTVEDIGTPNRNESFSDLWRRIPLGGAVTVSDAAARVRALRDEWDA